MIKITTYVLNNLKKSVNPCTFAILCTSLMLNTACGTNASVSTTSTETNIDLESVSNWYISGIPAETTMVTSHDLAVQYGTQIAIDEINAAGGIGGTMIAFSFNQSDIKFRIAASGETVQIVFEPEGIILESFPANDAGAQTDFIDKYTQMFGSEPDAYAITAYNCVHYIHQVLEQAAPVSILNTETAENIFSNN